MVNSYKSVNKVKSSALMAYLHIVIVVQSDSATSVTVRCQYIHPVYGADVTGALCTYHRRYRTVINFV